MTTSSFGARATRVHAQVAVHRDRDAFARPSGPRQPPSAIAIATSDKPTAMSDRPESHRLVPA